jgi:hypothetical protein
VPSEETQTVRRFIVDFHKFLTKLQLVTERARDATINFSCATMQRELKFAVGAPGDVITSRKITFSSNRPRIDDRNPLRDQDFAICSSGGPYFGYT